MEISGTIFSLLPIVTGEGKNGAWKKQEFILETEGQYPKKVCIAAWGDKFDGMLAEGAPVSVSFDAESREYNGRWYTELRAWKIDAGSATSAPAQPYAAAPSAPAQAATPAAPSPIPAALEGEDDLPF